MHSLESILQRVRRRTTSGTIGEVVYGFGDRAVLESPPGL
jgi:hypothetical protein